MTDPFVRVRLSLGTSRPTLSMSSWPAEVGHVNPAVRRAIAIAEQCVPWFVTYESWHTHDSQRSSHAAMLNQAHNDQLFEEFRGWRNFGVKMTLYVTASLYLDSEQLPLTERIARARWLHQLPLSSLAQKKHFPKHFPWWLTEEHFP